MPVEVLPEVTIVWPQGWSLGNHMKVVYVAGAFRAKTQWGIMQNVRNAEDASLRLWKQGYAVICPHTMTQHFQDECPDRVWLEGCLEILRRCDVIYLVKGWQESEGSKEEYQLAQQLGLEVIIEAR